MKVSIRNICHNAQQPWNMKNKPNNYIHAIRQRIDKIKMDQPKLKPGIVEQWVAALRSGDYNQHYLPRIMHYEIQIKEYKYALKYSDGSPRLYTKTGAQLYETRKKKIAVLTYDAFGVLTDLFFKLRKTKGASVRMKNWGRSDSTGEEWIMPEPPEIVCRWAASARTMWGLTLTIGGKRQTLINHLCEPVQPTFAEVADALEAEFLCEVSP
jgi:hypothetical protein